MLACHSAWASTSPRIGGKSSSSKATEADAAARKLREASAPGTLPRRDALGYATRSDGGDGDGGEAEGGGAETHDPGGRAAAAFARTHGGDTGEGMATLRWQMYIGWAAILALGDLEDLRGLGLGSPRAEVAESPA